MYLHPIRSFCIRLNIRLTIYNSGLKVNCRVCLLRETSLMSILIKLKSNTARLSIIRRFLNHLQSLCPAGWLALATGCIVDHDMMIKHGDKMNLAAIDSCTCKPISSATAKSNIFSRHPPLLAVNAPPIISRVSSLGE